MLMDKEGNQKLKQLDIIGVTSKEQSSIYDLGLTHVWPTYWNVPEGLDIIPSGWRRFKPLYISLLLLLEIPGCKSVFFRVKCRFQNVMKNYCFTMTSEVRRPCLWTW